MKKTVASIGVAIVAISLGIGLVGCGKESKKTTTSTSTSVATTSARASGPNETLGDYLKKNNIQETAVSHNTPGAPTINLPVPDGWTQLPESEDAPYGGMKLNAPTDPADPATFRFLLEKLTGNVNTDQLLAASVGDLKNQQDYDGSDGQKSTLGGFPAYQILGTYTKDGAKRVGAQKTVVIQGKDGIYLFVLRGRGLRADINMITDATNVIDEKTTITP
jgi:Probable lipoprotein LpqN